VSAAKGHPCKENSIILKSPAKILFEILSSELGEAHSYKSSGPMQGDPDNKLRPLRFCDPGGMPETWIKRLSQSRLTEFLCDDDFAEVK